MLDTHTFLWFIQDDARLSMAAMVAIQSRQNTVFISPVSYWEIAIKVSLGRYKINGGFVDFWEKPMLAYGFRFLPISLEHSAGTIGLPFHHKDPFDRLLAAQALAEGIPLVSRDAAFDAYGVTRIW